jgi:Sortase domain
MFYPKTGKIGQVGNPVIFGHSNFYKVGKGKYKTIFADIMNLDVGQDDEIWVFIKDASNKEYDLHKYRITESYETNPENVSILKPKGGKELTVFACTNGLAGRWILRGKYIEPDETLILNAMRKRFDTIAGKLKPMTKQKRQEIITKIVEKTQVIKDALPDSGRNYKQKYRAYMLDYIEKRLVEVY